MHKYLMPVETGFGRFKLGFLRHPESVRNEGGNEICIDPTSRVGQYSDREMPVSRKGYEQIAATVPAILKLYPNPVAIIHSGYTRTSVFAEALAQAYEKHNGLLVPLVWDISVRERDQGCNSHMLPDVSEHHFPWLDAFWKRQGPLLARPPLGESLADVMIHRTVPFINRMREQYRDKTVLVITHGRLMITVRWAIEDRLKYEELCTLTELQNAPKNCSLLSYEHSISENGLVLKEYNRIFY